MKEITKMKSPVRTILIAIALLLSFFPTGFLYALDYPANAIVVLLCWTFAFPSMLGVISSLLLPLCLSEAYGYFAFNLICVTTTIGAAASLRRCSIADEVWTRAYRVAEFCICATIFICLWQALDGQFWLRIFPFLQGIGGGRGCGLRSEPSLLAAPLALFLSLLAYRMHRVSGSSSRYVVEALIVIVGTIALTRSLSVAIAAACFIPAFRLRLSYLLLPMCVVLGVMALIFGDRIQHAATMAENSPLVFMTVAFGSWRNVPDILMLANYKDYLVPHNPVLLREHLGALASAWDPSFSWLENTYSTFSASASTLGLIVTTLLFVSGGVVGMRTLPRATGVRSTWAALYISAWFVFPKFEACGWVSLGVLMFVYDGASKPSTNRILSLFAKLLHEAYLSGDPRKTAPLPKPQGFA